MTYIEGLDNPDAAGPDTLVEASGLEDIFQDGRACWGWAEAEDAERWEGPFKSKDEAVAHGQANAQTYGACDELTNYGYVAEGRYIDVGKAAARVVDADDLLERMAEIETLAWDGNDPAFVYRSRDVAIARLEMVIARWATENVKPNATWNIVGNTEPVPPPASDR